MSITPDKIHLWRSAFVNAAIGMALVSPEGRWLEVNAALCEMFGYDEKELRSSTFQALTHPEDVEASLELVRRASAGELHHFHTEKRYLHRDGRVIWGLLTVSVVRDDEGRVRHFVSQIQDITRQKVQEAELRRQAEFRAALIELVDASLSGALDASFFQRVLDTAVDTIPGAELGSVLVRRGDRFHYVAARGYDLHELQRTYLLEPELFRGEARGPHLVRNLDKGNMPPERLAPILASGPSEEIEAVLAIPVYLAGRPIAYLYLDNLHDAEAFGDDALEMAQLLGQQVAVVWQRLTLEADLKKQRQAFKHLALHDRLTGLPNRLLLEDRLTQAIDQAERNGRAMAVVFLDLDDFKTVNDRHGHAVGDGYLEAVAARLRGAVRKSDTVARWGGDEFVVVLTNLARPEDAQLVVEKLERRFAEPVSVEGLSLEVRFSAGVALYPNHGVTADALLQRADEALYRAKGAGKGHARFHADG